MSGVTHRVGELVECLRAMPAEQLPFGQLGDISSEMEKRTNSSLVRKEPEDPKVAFSLRQILKTLLKIGGIFLIIGKTLCIYTWLYFLLALAKYKKNEGKKHFCTNPYYFLKK